MTIERKVGMGIAGQPTGPGPDVAEVFSVHTYTSNNADQGSGATQTINNGIDLAGEGGLVWIKNRNNSRSHVLIDTERGAANSLSSNSNAVSRTDYTGTNGSGAGASFNSNGFTVGDRNEVNASNGSSTPAKYVSWTFRKKKKFFDVVTYTGNAQANRKISHNLGSVPAMMIIKHANNDYSWYVYHKDLGNDHFIQLNSTGGASGASSNLQWNSTTPTATEFTVHTHTTTNGAPFTHVAYLFADNSSELADNQMIKCGSFTKSSASGTLQSVDIGWEPQFVLMKSSNSSGIWNMGDSMRGMVTGGDDGRLQAQAADGEYTENFIEVHPTGFKTNNPPSSYIYMAIRAPMMKEPEAATDVFAISPRTAAPAPNYVSGFPVDIILATQINTNANRQVFSRLTNKYVMPNTNDADAPQGGYDFDLNNGVSRSTGVSAVQYGWMWKRAKGFMDVVCYSGNGTAGRTVPHSLSVIPEMIWVKRRSGTNDWPVYNKTTTSTKYMFLSQATGSATAASIWNDTAPTSSVFTVGNYVGVNGSSDTYIAYLFATLDGISKVGSYTGNGTNQTISCGFSAGSRFILIKRTDATGSWYVWDSVRGIVAGNDPYLILNGTASQVTSDDSVDPANAGFIVNQVSASNINVSSATYIFYAIA